MSIDYGLGKTNIDAKTGIRYGVISQHTVGQAWYDDAEPDYGEAHCPKCGNKAFGVGELAGETADKVEEWPQYSVGCMDYACDVCEHTFDSQYAFGDEPLGWNYEGNGYQLTDCLDSDIMVLASPYYTFAEYCSPCVPGAGNLDSPEDSGAKTYCLGHDWFEDNKAPYPVYSVETGELVPATESV